MSAFEIALSDLGSPVQTDNIAAVLTRSTRIGRSEFSVVNQFDTGWHINSTDRLLLLDGDKTDGEDLLIGVGVQRENLRFEIQRIST